MHILTKLIMGVAVVPLLASSGAAYADTTVVRHRPGHTTVRHYDRHHHHYVPIVRPWYRRPYYGTVVAGVALGTLIAATAAPKPPDPSLCWYWSSAAHTEGYWDRCNGS